MQFSGPIRAKTWFFRSGIEVRKVRQSRKIEPGFYIRYFNNIWALLDRSTNYIGIIKILCVILFLRELVNWYVHQCKALALQSTFFYFLTIHICGYVCFHFLSILWENSSTFKKKYFRRIFFFIKLRLICIFTMPHSMLSLLFGIKNIKRYISLTHIFFSTFEKVGFIEIWILVTKHCNTVKKKNWPNYL